jgi:hypothetical protein
MLTIPESAPDSRRPGSADRLGERGAALLELATRYRLLTLDWLQLVFPEDSGDAIRMGITRLVADGWLRRFPLRGREPYFTLGPRAARLVLQPTKRERANFKGFGPDGILQHLGIAYFSAHYGLVRLLPEEFVAHFPDHNRPGLPAQNYLLKADGTDTTLLWAIVDHASSALRFPEKVARVVAKRMSVPAFAERMFAGGFAAAVLTGCDAKRERIESALAERPLQHVATAVITVPELEPYLFLGK